MKDIELPMMQEAHRLLSNLFDMGYQSEPIRLAIKELEDEIEIIRNANAK